jgi:hypothetical protein
MGLPPPQKPCKLPSHYSVSSNLKAELIEMIDNLVDDTPEVNVEQVHSTVPTVFQSTNSLYPVFEDGTPVVTITDIIRHKENNGLYKDSFHVNETSFSSSLPNVDEGLMQSQHLILTQVRSLLLHLDEL